ADERCAAARGAALVVLRLHRLGERRDLPGHMARPGRSARGSPGRARTAHPLGHRAGRRACAARAAPGESRRDDTLRRLRDRRGRDPRRRRGAVALCLLRRHGRVPGVPWAKGGAARALTSARVHAPFRAFSPTPSQRETRQMHAYRTHTCGALRSADVGANVRLSGWIHRKRDHGGLLFVDLRDHYGLTQLVAHPGEPGFDVLDRLRAESVVRVDGEVVARTPETVNPNLATGEIEVRVRAAEVLSEAAELPLPVFGEPEYPEEIRLKYRYLDLRRETLHRHIVLRSRVIDSIRRRMVEAGFTEFQTPILTASSPEGARDYLVPSRIHPGAFYALPQAPQQFKQQLMVAGFDRYFQIAPCFRDEDARADRSPGEFYQLDL